MATSAFGSASTTAAATTTATRRKPEEMAVTISIGITISSYDGTQLMTTQLMTRSLQLETIATAATIMTTNVCGQPSGGKFMNAS